MMILSALFTVGLTILAIQVIFGLLIMFGTLIYKVLGNNGG